MKRVEYIGDSFLFEKYRVYDVVCELITGSYVVSTSEGNRVMFSFECKPFHNDCEVIKIGDQVETKDYGLCTISYISSGGVVDLSPINGNSIIKCTTDQFVGVVSSPDAHYNNTSGSLYKFAEDHGLNAWEFDIVKRIARCRKKGQFTDDLEKTKRVIDLYLKEYECIKPI